MKTMIQAVAVTLIAASAAHAQQAVQWRVQDGGNGHWYGVTPQRGTWQQDRDFAKSMGGDLATITSESESVFLCSGLMDTGPWATEACWMGMTLSSAGAFEWVSGEPVAWTNWYPSGPHSPPYQVVWVTGPRNPGGSNPCWWNDADPNPSIGHIYFGLVEWSADCNNDGIVDYGQCRDGSLPDYNANNIPDCCESGTACVVGNYPVQWRVQDGGNGHWYQVRPKVGVWEACRTDAHASGGNLGSPSTQQENDFVEAIIPALRGARKSVLLGGRQSARSSSSSEWYWIDGSTWSYTDWERNQPDGDEGYLAMYSLGTSVVWGDYPSDDSDICCFLVEWSADCNNDGIVDYGQILQGQLADANADGIPDICQAPTCVDADLFRDFNVDGADLGILLAQWGPSTPLTVSDIDGDGVVNGADLGILLSFWGTCP